jgi:hypothetical protein
MNTSVEKQNVRDHVEDLGLDTSKILKRIIKEQVSQA